MVVFQCRVDEGTRQLFQFFAQINSHFSNNNPTSPSSSSDASQGHQRSSSGESRSTEIRGGALYVVGPLCPGVTRQVAAVLKYFNHTQVRMGFNLLTNLQI